MKKKNWIITIIAVLALAAGAWWYFKMRKPATDETIIGSSGSSVSMWPIKKGTKSDYVKQVQEALNRKKAAGLVTDGILGQATLDAMTKYYNPGKPFPHIDEFWFKAITK